MEISDAAIPAQEVHTALNMMLSRNANRDWGHFRTFVTYLDRPNILATYRPSYHVSPLVDETAQRIFCHFVTVTGPCISIFERQMPTSWLSHNAYPMSATQRGLWNYSIPTIALQHPPLMHAILAVSALHIAKLQKTSESPALKHFVYAMRRVARLLQLPKRRNEIPTLAATLLIGFYELIAAAHSKWSIHLSGAKCLVSEIDFASTTRRLRRMRSQARARIANTPHVSYHEYVKVAGIPEVLLPDIDWEVDENFVSQLTGFHVRYDSQWQPHIDARPGTGDLGEKDIEDFKLQSDLYWWYCKQDVFGSLVSSNRLRLPYEKWIFCPPRGQFGTDKTHAVMDHLCLLMARLADFGAKDQKRKTQATAAQGGQWRPPPGFFGPTRTQGQPLQAAAFPAQQHPSQQPSLGPGDSSRPEAQPGPTQQSTSQGPPHPGTLPSSTPPRGMQPEPEGPIDMHSAFHQMSASINDPAFPSFANFNNSDPTDTPPAPTDPEGLASQALAEHAAIVQAFDLFHTSLTPYYDPLPRSANPPAFSPFGEALFYRTYPIACIMALYNVGRILTHRLHPHMPPAALVAAGVTAHLTKDYANTIGRICAGLYSNCGQDVIPGTVPPALGAAMIELCFSLFFAAAQYQDAGQRKWTVEVMNDVARFTGHQSSVAEAAGCEVCWERMWRAGKGPEYVPTTSQPNGAARVKIDEPTEPMDSALGDKKANTTWLGEGTRWEQFLHVKKQDGGQPWTARMIQEREDEEEASAMINHDRRKLASDPNARVHYGVGILGMEEDLKQLDLGKA